MLVLALLIGAGRFAREARGHGVPEVMIAVAENGGRIRPQVSLAFKAALYETEDRFDRIWKGRPDWARPAVGGLALGLLLLALPQMYGVGYPVMYKTPAGQYALWFVIVLAFAKIAATSLSIGIGGSGGVFAPSLFIGVTSGMAFGDVVHHAFGASAGDP